MWNRIGKLIGRIKRQRSGHDVASRPAILGLDDEALVVAGVMLPADEIERRLLAMPIMVREVFLLITVDRMTTAEVAHRLAISRRATRRHLAAGVKSLARKG